MEAHFVYFLVFLYVFFSVFPTHSLIPVLPPPARWCCFRCGFSQGAKAQQDLEQNPPSLSLPLSCTTQQQHEWSFFFSIFPPPPPHIVGGRQRGRRRTWNMNWISRSDLILMSFSSLLRRVFVLFSAFFPLCVLWSSSFFFFSWQRLRSFFLSLSFFR